MIFLFLLSFVPPAITGYKSITFNQQCEGYLKQAADASTPEIALDRLNIAIDYIEAHNLTSGYTSILWKTQDEDMGYWYNNLITCRGNLEKCFSSTQLEKDNALMRVREVLTDQGEKGTTLTIPDGISRAPHNTMWAILNTISGIILCLGFMIISVAKSWLLPKPNNLN